MILCCCYCWGGRVVVGKGTHRVDGSIVGIWIIRIIIVVVWQDR